MIPESSKRIPTTSYGRGRVIPETHLFPGGAKIKYDFTDKGFIGTYSLGIKISKYFSIKYITFCNVSCRFEADKDRSINDKDFARIHYYSQMHLHSCTFAGYDTCLTIDSINKSIIINCAMVSFLRIFGSINTKENMIFNICDISYSAFSGKYLDCIRIFNNTLCVINFTNNVILKAFTLFEGQGAVITATHNKIYNMYTCATRCSDIRFENNYFDNVESLYEVSSNIIANNTNTFVNCGKRLMNQIKIENAMQ